MILSSHLVIGVLVIIWLLVLGIWLFVVEKSNSIHWWGY